MNKLHKFFHRYSHQLNLCIKGYFVLFDKKKKKTRSGQKDEKGKKKTKLRSPAKYTKTASLETNDQVSPTETPKQAMRQQTSQAKGEDGLFYLLCW